MKKIHMNKSTFITSVAVLSGLSKASSALALEAMLQSIQKTLKDGKEVKLSGFGLFSVTHRPEREGRNPRTGVTIKLSASKLPKFRSWKSFKEAIA